MTKWWTLCDSVDCWGQGLFCYKKGRAWLFSWHFYGCCTLFLFGFWWEGKSTEMFCNFFYVLLGFLLFCWVSEGRSVPYVAGGLAGLSPTPQLLNLPLTVLNFGIKVWKSAQCNVYRTGWLRRHLLHILFYMDVYMSYFTERIKDKSVLVPHCRVQLSDLVFVTLKAINQ